jgi:hypothetical protein
MNFALPGKLAELACRPLFCYGMLSPREGSIDQQYRRSTGSIGRTLATLEIRVGRRALEFEPRSARRSLGDAN